MRVKCLVQKHNIMAALGCNVSSKAFIILTVSLSLVITLGLRVVVKLDDNYIATLVDCISFQTDSS